MNITLIAPAEQSGFSLYGIVVKNSCLVREFIESLEEKYQKQIMSLLDFISAKGPPNNKEKFRSLGDDIFELKTRSGVRILSFFGGSNLPKSLILIHGFHKPSRKILVREKAKAISWHKKYFAEEVKIV
jgi:phage-related protein